MRWSVALACTVLLAIPVQAQVQPDAPPDAAAFTARTDLAEAGSLVGAQRVLRFVQVSDAHILDDDAPYPMRQEQLDPFITAFSTAAQRPQDEFTDEVLESIVRAINAQHAADQFQFVINTGDNVDNDLENELMRFIDLWDGTTTTTGPVSGLACAPDGQSTSIADEAHDVEDKCTSLPESLLANRTALAAGLPWYSAFGNHDGLIQGNVNPNEQFDAVAAQHGRHFLTQPEYVDMHFAGGDGCNAGSTDDDFGHGYGLAADRLCDDDPDNDGYYAYDLNGVRFIVLDTLNDDFASANGFAQPAFNPQTMVGADVIGGYAEGAVDPAQMAWLRAELAANTDKLIVAFSHHTVNSMFTNLADGYCQSGRCMADALHEAGYGTGDELTAELAALPNVVAWIGGHTHRNRIEPKGAEAAGFWNIESSSLIDYPQQARVVELWVTDNGTKGFWLLKAFTHDFQLSKDLELTDDQRVPEGIGDADDQDTILWFDVPMGVKLKPQPLAPFDWNVAFDQATTQSESEVDSTVPLSPGIVTLDFTARSASGRLLPPSYSLPPSAPEQNPLGYRAFVVGHAIVRHKAQVIATPTVSLVPAPDGLMLHGEVDRFVADQRGDYEVELNLTLHQQEAPATSSLATTTFSIGKDGASGAKDSPPLAAVAVLGLALALALARRR